MHLSILYVPALTLVTVVFMQNPAIQRSTGGTWLLAELTALSLNVSVALDVYVSGCRVGLHGVFRFRVYAQFIYAAEFVFVEGWVKLYVGRRFVKFGCLTSHNSPATMSPVHNQNAKPQIQCTPPPSSLKQRLRAHASGSVVADMNISVPLFC